MVGNPTKISHFVQWKKSAIERCSVFSKRGYPLLSILKFKQRCVGSKNNSWFWIYKKQATGVSMLVDIVKFKAYIISSVVIWKQYLNSE